MSVNVASHLARMAAEYPDRPAVHVPVGPVNPHADTPHRTLTFRELNADADAVAAGLRSIGIDRGTRVALMVPPGADFFALTFALFKIAAVPVMIDPGMGIKNLGKCLGEAEPVAFIGIAKAHLARRLFGWAKRSIKVTVNVGRRRFFCTRSIAELRECSPHTPCADQTRPHTECAGYTPDDLAAVLFTSGSTGIAKGVEYTHGIFAAQVDLLKATYGIQPGEVDLCTFPLFALFGPALGMTCVVPDMDASRPATLDPHKAMSQMRQFRVTNLFGSPAVVRRLAQLVPLTPVGEGRLTGFRPECPPLTLSPLPPGARGTETLRRVISAGAPANIPVIEQFTKLLPPGVQVFTPYGATEALPVANIGSDEILRETRHLTEQGKGVCVGRPVAGMTVHVVRITDDAIAEWSDTLCVPPGVVGEFVVRGPVVTKRYFRRDEATKLAKILDRDTGEVLHRMGDVGYIDEVGRMWFCGRKSHRVDTPHGPLFTDMVEPVFNAVREVERTALVSVRRDGIQHPVICIQPRKLYPPSVGFGAEWDPTVIEKRLREIAPRHAHTRRIETFLIYGNASFPVDVRHNSKIFREKLAVWADQTLGPKWKGGPA